MDERTVRSACPHDCRQDRATIVTVRVFHGRGNFAAIARLTNRVRPGLAVAPALWRNRTNPGGTNGNQTTSAAPPKSVGAATLDDNRVEIQPIACPEEEAER